MASTVHYFDSTEEAYDASQCDDNVRHGDILVVESEQATAVLMQAWPIAVTEHRGEFHAVKPGIDMPTLVEKLTSTEQAAFLSGVRKAIKVGKEVGIKASAPKPRTVKITVTLDIEINADEWGNEYGIAPEDVPTDVRSYVLTEIQGTTGIETAHGIVKLRPRR